ncbi:conserved hypothetical protein [Culex quinquefasciatus]|uniref:CRAL/TRIO N-terminal domain-containing protein n=1 Tax=Culex quinquefasciatus TaxID=7176 RepID=B0X432_CULQU|nr:conserved hypothetical protein [Culex quinquefasciatus]|eukprot:XP_001864404.1 conserved hypothetical protein [Culex quinquefasciatus]
MSTYKFTLSEQFRTLAKEELREEDDAVRLDAINQLRDWIVKNPAIKHCRTDDVFLLKFLRFRKFAVHQAGESIERYLAARQKMPQWFQGTDPNADPLASIMDDCPITVLGRDDAGRTVIFIRVASYDAETLTQDSIMRYVMMMLDTLTEQEEVQIGGVRIWMDCTGISMSRVLFTCRVRDDDRSDDENHADSDSADSLGEAAQVCRFVGKLRANLHQSEAEGAHCVPPHHAGCPRAHARTAVAGIVRRNGAQRGHAEPKDAQTAGRQTGVVALAR